jgi:hypothetical protein
VSVGKDLVPMEVVGVKILADKPLQQLLEQLLQQLLQGGGKFLFTMTASLAGLSRPSTTSALRPG